jgi:hypothetical protein
MKLQYSVPLSSTEHPITHHAPVMMIGSCFSENITQRMKRTGFSVLNNPHGIIYNPISLRQSLEDVLYNKKFDEKDLYFDGYFWHSDAHHGVFSSPTSEITIKRINQSITRAHESLSQISHLIITLGSAWTYYTISDNKPVANCHKQPGKKFFKKTIEVNTEKEKWIKILEELKNKNPNANIILTISPVKHLKDGAFENNYSKGLLHQLVAELLTAKNDIKYFPAFEILQDELRDYRFYTGDFAHPNDLAIDYIWSRFEEVYFSNESKIIVQEINQLKSLFQHRIMYEETQQSQKFLAQRAQMLSDFKTKWPTIQLDFI